VTFWLHLTHDDGYEVGCFRVNVDGSLDVWQTPDEDPDGWWGVYAAHAWHSVIPDDEGGPGDDDSGEVVPLRGA
jgi:hypothetical protein